MKKLTDIFTGKAWAASIPPATTQAEKDALAQDLWLEMEKHGHADIKKCLRLIKAGANVDLPNKNNVTMLNFACNHVLNERISLALVDVSADINAVNQKNETPLYGAVFSGNARIFQALLDKGADVSIQTKNFETVQDFINLHLRYGKKENARPYREIQDILTRAVAMRKDEKERAALQGDEFMHMLGNVTQGENTALDEEMMQATNRGHRADRGKVLHLLESGADPHLGILHGVRMQDAEMVDIALGLNPAFNQSQPDIFEALSTLASGNNRRGYGTAPRDVQKDSVLLEKILNAADGSKYNKGGEYDTLLAVAILNKKPAAVRLLVKHGARIDNEVEVHYDGRKAYLSPQELAQKELHECDDAVTREIVAIVSEEAQKRLAAEHVKERIDDIAHGGVEEDITVSGIPEMKKKTIGEAMDEGRAETAPMPPLRKKPFTPAGGVPV